MVNDLPAHRLVRRFAPLLRSHARGQDDEVLLLLDWSDAYARAVARALNLPHEASVAIASLDEAGIATVLAGTKAIALQAGLRAQRAEGELRVVVLTAGLGAVVVLGRGTPS